MYHWIQLPSCLVKMKTCRLSVLHSMQSERAKLRVRFYLKCCHQVGFLWHFVSCKQKMWHSWQSETDLNSGHALLCCPAGMAGGFRPKSGPAPPHKGAGATDLLQEEGVHTSGGRGACAEATPPPSGVFLVWRGTSGGSWEAQAGQHLLPALWTGLQGGRDGLLLQVWI